MAFVQKTNASVNGSSPSPALTGVTAGNTLVLILSSYLASDSTPTDSSGQTWGKAFFNAGTVAHTGMYYLLNANAGTHTLTWGAGSGSTYITYSLVEIPACSALDVAGTVVTQTGNPTTATASVTTVAASTIIIGVLSEDWDTGQANQGITDPPTGFSSISVQQDAVNYMPAEHCYKEVLSQGTYTANWSLNADPTAQSTCAALVSFVKSGGAVGLPPNKIFGARQAVNRASRY